MPSILRILTITAAYPNPKEPGHSPFVRARMQHVAAQPEVQVKVIAPVPLLDYSNPHGDLLQSLSIPRQRHDGPIETFHPRWLFPPFGTPWNVLFQFVRLLWPVARLRRR
jgi:hypothetical protein